MTTKARTAYNDSCRILWSNENNYIKMNQIQKSKLVIILINTISLTLFLLQAYHVIFFHNEFHKPLIKIIWGFFIEYINILIISYYLNVFMICVPIIIIVLTFVLKKISKKTLVALLGSWLIFVFVNYLVFILQMNIT